MRLARLSCAVQPYAWGRVGSESTVAQLTHGSGGARAGKPIDAEQPYAELWMGTHVNGPSSVQPATDAPVPAEGVPLSKWLSEEGRLGSEAAVELSFTGGSGSGSAAAEAAATARTPGHLPFLFKVLSVAKALSIQAHPDRGRAAKLHAARPDVYRDANHKPEMATALTPTFEALCGFREVSEVQGFLKTVPELREAVGPALADTVCAVDCAAVAPGTGARAAALRDVLGALVDSDEAVAERVSAQARALCARLDSKPEADRSELERVVVRVGQQFPGDNGIFCCYVLNFLTLKRGESLFLAANEPHAYLAGDCAEVMAASDNVVRAGLTPKLKDKDTLLEMLTYREGLPQVLTGTALDANTTVYRAPVPEFELHWTTLSKGAAATLPASPVASIILCTAGANITLRTSSDGGEAAEETITVSQGGVVAVAAGTTLVASAPEGAAEDAVLLRCAVNADIVNKA